MTVAAQTTDRLVRDSVCDVVPGQYYDTADSMFKVANGASGGIGVSQMTLLSGEDQTNNVIVVEQGQFSYETVAASQADQILGAIGATGDLLHKLIITVAAAATGTVDLKDGNGSVIPITAANTPIGVYVVELNAVCANATTPGWKVTTGAGATVLAIGRFS